MKLSLKQTLLIGLIGLMSSNMCLGQVVQRTIIKSIDLQQVNEVIVSNGQAVSVEQWDRSYARICIDVKTIGVNKQTFMECLRKKRYQCIPDIIEGTLVLELPNLAEPLSDNIQEEIQIRVLIPQANHSFSDSRQVLNFIQ